VTHDAVVVGSGPNGLAAAITLARAGRSVVVLEAADTIGGGMRSAQLTLPGFIHDVCSAVLPLGVASPFFATTPLADHGLRWSHPELPLAHPLDGRPAAVLHASVADTAAQFERGSKRYRRLLGPLVDRWEPIAESVLQPVLSPPRHPIALATFGARALPPATLISRYLGDDRASAMFAGCAAHAFLPLSHPLTASFGTLLLLGGHAVGWPSVAGGTQVLADAMGDQLLSLGGEIRTHTNVASLADVPAHRVVLFDTDPHQLASIAAGELPSRYRHQLTRFEAGPAAWKVDYALDGPVPWSDEACRRAGTVHVGGTSAEIAAAEADVARGRMPERPFVLAAQQSLVDPTRAPAGKHTLWTYAHVPNGYGGDATDALERQLERFAPGFRDRVLARHVTSPSGLEEYNPNCRGGDIAGGSHRGSQLVFRPTRALRSYRTPNPGIWLCSASTPPGGGVHGMCGHNAARAVLRGPLA
jgi:phytoene dehydrogenase-like protein